MFTGATGCGGDGGESAPQAGVTASLAWSPVPGPSISASSVHYGQQSPGQTGSCAYESSMNVDSPSATITNLEHNTRYYFTVSAYNGLESACSSEVSTVTPPPPPFVQTDPRSPNRPLSPNRAPEMPIPPNRT
ncbi:MAG TPA: fibronectin type III domain-containing protein [Nitrospiraceae bacterium]|nr:fibronectin type III domain-containing protein [Nitrospiraceae bacterium]